MKTILSLCTFIAATASMNAQSITAPQSGNILDILSGNIAGTNVINYSGDPTSSGPYIMINGIRSFTYQSPLFIVDGIIYDGDVSSINPNDVESISVIDDAATLAKYGNRANNGVIAIKTKSGKRSKSSEPKERINFRGKWGVNSDAIGQYDLATADEYRNFLTKEEYYSQRISDTEVKTVNNYDDYFRNSMRQEYNIDYANEFDKGNIFASIGFLDNNGLFKDNSYKRLTARVNARYNPTENIKLGINTSLTFDNRKKSVDDYEYMLDIMAGAPLMPTDEVESFYNSIPNLDYKQTASVFSLNAFADFKLTEALRLNVNVSWVSNNTEYKKISKKGELDFNKFTSTNLGTRYNGYYQMDSIGLSSTYTTLTPEVKLSWSKDWNNSALYLQGGYMHHSITKDMSGKEQDLDLRPYGSNRYNMPMSIYEYDEYDAITASCNWYKGNFSVDANVRFQNSSLYKQINDENKWFTNWGVKTAWNIPVKVSNINMLEVYASYGKTGNDAPIKEYIDKYNRYLLLNSLDYEKTTTLTIGGHTTLFNNRLTADIKFFHNKNHDVTKYIYYRRVIHVDTKDFDISNNGVNLTVKGTPIQNKDFRWDISLNLSHYRNKLSDFKYEIEAFNFVHVGVIKLKNGDDITSIRLKEFAGVDNNNRTLYYLKDGSTSINTDNARTKNYGNNTPDLFGGLGNTIRYRNFDFHLGLGFQIGGKVFDSDYYEMMYCGRIFKTNIHKDLLNKGDIISVRNRVRYDCITNASYLNINNVVFGYFLTKDAVKPLHVRSLRIYADADNLALFSARKGMDPRNLSFYGAGINVGFYPMMRTISLGVEVGL
ncbi:MAG: TonB-dependent receptor plug domain-containing protein [Bacteroidaceae bacterium]|nr:TonB-dependent receptor plug domain-containing protein [Bacteroidaceae bacterium]